MASTPGTPAAATATKAQAAAATALEAVHRFDNGIMVAVLTGEALCVSLSAEGCGSSSSRGGAQMGPPTGKILIG